MLSYVTSCKESELWIFGYLWIPLDTFGYLWIPLDTFGYLEILLDTLDTFGTVGMVLCPLLNCLRIVKVLRGVTRILQLSLTFTGEVGAGHHR